MLCYLELNPSWLPFGVGVVNYNLLLLVSCNTLFLLCCYSHEDLTSRKEILFSTAKMNVCNLHVKRQITTITFLDIFVHRVSNNILKTERYSKSIAIVKLLSNPNNLKVNLVLALKSRVVKLSHLSCKHSGLKKFKVFWLRTFTLSYYSQHHT